MTGGDPDDSPPRAEASTQPTRSASEQPEPGRVPPELVQPAWQIDDARRTRGPDALPAVVGPEDALGAPSLLDDPLPAVVIAFRDSLFAAVDTDWPDGDLALLGTDGTWRSLSQTDLGLRNDEVSFSLSHDGSRLAVGDRRAVQVVDVTSGEVRRYPVPFEESIGLEWTGDDRYLHLEDRSGRPDQPVLLDLRDGSRRAVPYSIFSTDFAANGTPVELRVSARTRRAWLLVHRPHSLRRIDLSVTQRLGARQPSVGSLVAIERQSLDGRNRGSDVEGVLVVDRSGAPLAHLPMGTRWTDLQGWLDPGTLLIGEGYGGGAGGWLLAWSWETEQVRLLTRFAPGGVDYAVATDTLR